MNNTIKTAAVATCPQCVHYRDDSASRTRYYCEKIGRSFDDNDGLDYMGCEFIAREQHDYIAISESYFQKKCLPDEVVHHIDGDRTHNAPENLVIMKRSQHSKIHASLYCGLDEWRKKVSRPLCNGCFFVSVYESFNLTEAKTISPEKAAFLGTIRIGSEAKPPPFSGEECLEIINHIYADILQWKLDNDHDCYEGKNLSIVTKRS